MAEVNDLSLLLLSIKSCHRAVQSLNTTVTKLRTLHDAEPDKNYSTHLKCVKEDLELLRRIIEQTAMEEAHPLRSDADKAMDRAYQILADLNKPPAPAKVDVKPTLPTDDTLGAIKMTPFSPPKFSGEQKDWISFSSEFKAIHDATRYSSASKLEYLRQAMQNPSLQISTSIDNGDKYETVMANLRDQFDRPRLTHKIYVYQLLGIGQVKPYRYSILDCANTLQSVWDGLVRLGQCDAQSIFTTITESLLPKELRIRWEDETISTKKVPPVQKLIEFLKLRSTQPQYEDKAHYSNAAPERKAPAKPKFSGQKGSIHVASGQPARAPSPQNGSSSSNTPAKGNSGSYKSKTQFFTPCRYTCPLCQEAHYAYSCKAFNDKTVTQRMEFATAQSLCSTCLKPGHTPDVCRNNRTCHVCK